MGLRSHILKIVPVFVSFFLLKQNSKIKKCLSFKKKKFNSFSLQNDNSRWKRVYKISSIQTIDIHCKAKHFPLKFGLSEKHTKICAIFADIFFIIFWKGNDSGSQYSHLQKKKFDFKCSQRQ